MHVGVGEISTSLNIAFAKRQEHKIKIKQLKLILKLMLEMQSMTSSMILRTDLSRIIVIESKIDLKINSKMIKT